MLKTLPTDLGSSWMGWGWGGGGAAQIHTVQWAAKWAAKRIMEMKTELIFCSHLFFVGILRKIRGNPIKMRLFKVYDFR